MENKSNSLNRLKRHQREKVLRFSIRKYSFGAASVAVAALMFLGARVASADTLNESSSQSTAGVVHPNDKGDSPVIIENTTENKSEVVNSSLENKETALVENSSNTVDKSQLRTVVEELNSLLSTKLNLDDSVLSSVKERVQIAQALLDKADAVQKDINELKELLSTDLATLSNAVKESSEVRESNTGTEAEKPASQPSSEVRASEENQTVSAKKDSLKVSVDQLKVAISEVPEHDTTKAVLEKANELLGLAQGVLQNTTVSLTDVEQMNKLVKRMFTSVKNATTRLSSGSHDPRNGKRIAEGTGFRADGVRVEGALDNVKEYISEPNGQGSTVEGNRPRTIEKIFMTAKYSKEGNKKFITYDVYFNNNGKALGGNYVGDAFWFYPPRDLLYDAGRSYPVGVVSDAYYERYEKKAGATGTLSENPNNFTRVGDRYTVPLERLASNSYQDSYSQRLWGAAGGLYQMSGGPTRNDQRQQMLKQLQYNKDLNRIIKLNNNPDGPYPGGSYSHLLTISKQQNFAYKYHVKMRLKDDVTDAQAQRAGTMAVTAKAGAGTTALEAYVYAATGTRLVSKPAAQIDPIQGLTVTKTVGDTLGNPDDPANSGYVRHKENKPFPAGMKWSWQNGVKPASTATTAGVFKYKVIASYQDDTSSENPGSGSDGTVTLNVKPKTPVIDKNSVNEKAGKTEQTVTVNVGNGVPKDSIVTLYSDNTVIGTGKTNGTTATIKVSKALPSTAITARTSVQNGNDKVESEFSAPVIPTPERDTQPPTVKMTNPTNNKESVLGSSENNSPEVEVFRGATLDIPLKMHDNNANGKINIKHINGLPKGVNLNNGNTLTTNSGSETKPATATISGRVATDAHLGTNVVTLKASDDATGNVDKGNQATLKFKVKTYDLAFEDRGTPVNDNTRSDVLGLKQRSSDPNHYLTTTDGTNKGDGNFGADMKFRYLKGNEISEHVSFDKIGKYDVKARAYFPNSKTSTKGLPTNPTTGLTGDTASVAGRGFLEKTIQFNVKPNTPSLAQEQFYGTAGSQPSVTVGNLPTSDQLQNGSNVMVELYQGTTKVASKTVTDRNGTTTLSAGDFTANLREGQPVHAVVKVSGGQNAASYSVTSDNSANRNVTGYNLVARDIINVKRGETISADELKRFIQVQEGNQRVDLPQGATVTATLETASIRSGKEETKTVEATVNFGENRTKKINLTYKVLNTFPIARTLYDFKNPDTARSGGSSVYYHNGGTIPDGMTWIYKASDNVAQPGDKFTEALAKDPVGTTNYKFGGKYDYSRNTNRPTTTGNLEYTETVTHKVFDIEANSTKVTVSKGATLTEANAKAAVTKVAGSEDLPTGTTYEWVGNTETNTPGVRTYKVKVTLPVSQTGTDAQPVATQVRSSKTIDVTVNVKPDVPTYNTTIKANGNIKVPTVASTDKELTGTGAPGAKIKVTVPGVTINEVTVGSNGKWAVTLPKGLNSNQLNQRQLVPQDPVTITQSVGGVESDPVNVAVSLGETTIQPSVASKDGVSLVAGTKNIVVKTPHDAGMVYVSYTDKATGKAHEIGLKRENINSPWVSIKPTLGVVTNTSKDAFTNNITIEMKESIAEGTAKAIANISEGKYSSAVDWKTIQVTNQAPTVTSAVAGNEKVVEFGENIDLKTLVTKADYEDDKDATRGTKVRTEIVSVNGQNDVKDINSRKPGTYIVKYKAIDSQGKESGEIQLTVKVREDKPTPPTVTAPSDGTITVTPTGDADKVIVNYTDEKNAQKTVTVVKAKNGTWSSSDKPAGVTVDPRTGALLIPEDGVRDRSQVTATATKGDSRPSDPKIVTAQQRDFVPVVPDKTPVTKVTNLTPEEREKVKAKVQTRNPGKNISISTDGTATLTDPKTNISHQISGDKLVESNDKIKPTVEIPYDNPARQEIYVYSGETNNITIKVKDNSGKISKSYLVFAANDRRGLGAEDNSYLGGGSSNGLYLTATKIHSDTPTSENQPATITVSGNLNNQPFTGEKSITRYVFAEDPSGNTNYDHVGRTDDTGALGRVKFVWKSQTSKYDAQAPGTPLLLDNADATQIENAVKQANPTFSDKIKSVTVNGNNVIVTYKDDSTDRLDASKVFKVRDSNPTPPTATAPSDGTVTVTPTGDADKVTVNYTDEKEQNKTVTVVKDKNGTWSSSDKPAGVTVDSSTGQLLIPAEGVKDKSQVTATATKGDSHPSEPTTVTAQAKDFTPVKPDEKVVVQDKSHLTPEEKKQVEDKVKAKNPGKTVTVGEDGTATVTDPSTKISHPIAGKDLVNEGFGVNGIPEVTPSQPEYTDPVGTSSTDGNGNLIDPPTVELPEFNGGVNGELPDPVEIPKVKLIITKWIDEQGNELKPADAKAPAVLGEANEAFEHGEIEGYVFVRTDVNEEGDVVTHVFRKVTPTKPEGNGEQQGGDNTPQPTPEVPTDNTERKPETEKPTVPDTKQAEQSTQTVDAQVAPSQNQAVLPNTGTKADRATGALGALSLLGAFGLLFAKKKKDDEEETRNN